MDWAEISGSRLLRCIGLGLLAGSIALLIDFRGLGRLWDWGEVRAFQGGHRTDPPSGDGEPCDRQGWDAICRDLRHCRFACSDSHGPLREVTDPPLRHSGLVTPQPPERREAA